MKYQKIINLLDNTPNQTSEFKTKNWVEINDDAREMCNKDSQMKFKTLMLKSSLCGYSDAYILAKETITIEPVPPPALNPNNNDKKVVFKNCAPFNDCISEITHK